LDHAGQPKLGELIEYRVDQQFQSPNQSVVVAWPADVAMKSWGGIAARFWRGVAIEPVVGIECTEL
jgi:hypothetical protein